MKKPTPDTDAVAAYEGNWDTKALRMTAHSRKLERERDELLDILRKLLEIIPEPECHDFGHTKEERHTFFEKCPVMERYDALIAQAEEAAK